MIRTHRTTLVLFLSYFRPLFLVFSPLISTLFSSSSLASYSLLLLCFHFPPLLPHHFHLSLLLITSFFYHILESFFNFPLSSSFYCPTFSCPPPSPSSSHLSACSFLLPLLSPSRSPACCFKLDLYLFAQLKQYMDSIEDLHYKNFVLVSACSLSGSRSVSPSG